MLIRGGVTASATSPSGTAPADVLIEGERIVAIGQDLDTFDHEVVDASGFLLLPGLIDVHVHVREPGAAQKEDWETATRAALAGGVTTILDMPNNEQPVVNEELARAKLAVAEQRALCDFGVYLGASADNAGLISRLDGLVAGLKVYLGSTTGSLLTDDWRVLYEHLKATPAEIPVAVHAEDEQCLRAFSDTSPNDHDRNRPAICAELAVCHVIQAARAAGRGVHVAHVSTPGEVRAIVAARVQRPDLTFEVCPHHLFLTSDDARRMGGWGKVNPPLRSPAAVLDLWELLPRANLIATDHAPHTPAEKNGPFRQAPSGFPGLETKMPLLLLAVCEGRLPLAGVVRLTAAAPAHLYRLADKGALATGKHADIVAVDLSAQTAVDPAHMRSKAKWTPFAGWRLPGRVVHVWQRGEHVVADNQVIAQPGRGVRVRIG